MEFDDDHELLARLRAADPAADLEPAPAKGVARLLEDIMEHPTTDTGATAATTPDSAAPADRAGDLASAAGPGRRRVVPWLVAAAAVAILATVGFTLNRGGDSPSAPPAAAGQAEATSTSISAPAAAAGKCLMPTAETLGSAELAVDGTVTDLAGDEVTLAVHHWYAGTATDELVVTSPPASLQALIGAPDLVVGQRYLLAANNGQLMVCGFSGPFDTDRSSLYTAAFGG